MGQIDLFLPMIMEARWAIHRLASQEVISDILLLLKEINPINELTDYEIAVRYKALNRFEQELYHYEVLVQMETSQILYLSSPKKHKRLIKEFNSRIENIEDEFNKKKLFELIQTRNIETIEMTPRPDGEYQFSTSKIRPNKLIEQLSINSFEFEEISEFFLHKVREIKKCVSLKHQVIVRGSYFKPFSFDDLVIDKLLFIEVCEDFCKQKLLPNDKEFQIISRQKNKFIWQGTGVGNGIPSLAAFLLRLNELKIIKVSSTRRFAEFFFSYFSIPLENNNYKFLLDSLRKVNKSYSEFFEFEIK